VIADYGHNPDAIAALVAGRREHAGARRSVVISGAGDRRDEDIRGQTRILGAAFDDVILYQDACQRGRADGEVLALLREGLQGAARTTHVEEIHGEFIAIDRALGRLQARRPVPDPDRPGGRSAGPHSAVDQHSGRGASVVRE
jgi:cyanophycin synthetase